MIIRVVDNTPLEKLSEGSHKKIIFVCESCGLEVEQAYRNYLNQNNGKFCRSCRNAHTANRSDVLEKQKVHTTRRWQDPEYRKMMVEEGKLSRAVKASWDKNGGSRRKWLSTNNPMNDKETRSKQSESESTSEEELKTLVKSYGYEYLGRILRQRGGVKINVKCQMGHITTKHLHSFRSGSTGCSICCQSFSQAEKELAEYVRSLGVDIVENNRSIISPLELDIVVPEKNIAIEYCGLYWHGETKGKDKGYHLNKLNMCNEEGYRLITVFEDEWMNKQDVVKTRLKHILGFADERIYARKCAIKEITSVVSNEFIKKYHIQGRTSDAIRLGMYHQGDLVAVMSFSKPSLSKGQKGSIDVFELSRFCSSKHIVGGASKLLEHFKRNYKWTEIYTYADKRWSEGNVYEQLGFKHDSLTKPNYWYFNINELGIKRKHRFNYRKDRLPTFFPGCDMSRTEWEIMQLNGYDRIWDCGNIKYVMYNQ